ncbi:hypothetical protein F511_41390 [Dorcoceras hygrometricum]|uniref:Ribosomal RNA-processing protein 7 C-terminal domain-containing protein n=1 Tax=Dorcoceras hygrometricum TaxID=472368 RepID=A0A2Z6ZZH3_9LAMI|nr:hypothetical protein F511_41390 [Dorcoceras hygrometricum]
MGEANGGNERCKKKNKRKIGKRVKTDKDETVTPNCVIEGRISGKKNARFEEKDKLQNPRKKEKKIIECVGTADAFNEEEDASERQNVVEKPKMSAKKKRKRRLLGKESSQDDLLEKKRNAADDEADQMSSGDEDCSKGMKKWIMQYHQSRPGIKVLQERIDDFITAHEAQQERARKEREAQAAEGGWTVVVHHKGRKKTTDAESGTTVGSVAQAAILDKMAKKKSKEVGLDFYRFQRREAHRNEIMMLQSKFEQDKKRIQEMRAARKFRPY